VVTWGRSRRASEGQELERAPDSIWEYGDGGGHLTVWSHL
jgi:hypothetical protein